MLKKITYALCGYITILFILRLPFWQSIDNYVAHFFIQHRTPTLTAFFDIFTHLASTKFTIILAIIFFAILLIKKHIQDATQFAATLITSAGIVAFVKIIVQRARPMISQLHSEASYSFPSGHTNAATTLLGFCMLYIFKHTNSRKIKTFTCCIGVAIILLIAISRLYLSVHWLTDIFAGLSTACFSIYVWNIVFSKSIS